MSDSLNHKLIEAIPEDQRDAAPPVLKDMPGSSPHPTSAEQQREAPEN